MFRNDFTFKNGTFLQLYYVIVLKIMENAEINNIVKILGLQYKKKYETIEDLKTLRYGKLMIMTDQDQVSVICFYIHSSLM